MHTAKRMCIIVLSAKFTINSISAQIKKEGKVNSSILVWSIAISPLMGC